MSLLALVCFYAFAFAVLAGTAYGAFLLGHYVTVMYWVAIVAALTGVLVLVTLVSAAWSRQTVEPGVDLSPEAAPELWSLVAGLAHTAATRGPDQIRLVAEANAAVSEDTKMFGLIGGSRRMTLGVPLLMAIDVTQLSAVLAHELGHYSGRHTRLGPIAYRGWEAVTGTMRELQGDDVNWLMRTFGYVLRMPAGIYLMLSLAMRRSQEREADRLMVTVAGRAHAKAALQEVAVTGVFWDFYLRDYVGYCWGQDLAPVAEEFFAGFRRMLDGRSGDLETARREVEAMRPKDAAEKTTQDYARELLATHPPIVDRIAAIEDLPDREAAGPPDERPAHVLLPGGAAAAVAEAGYEYGDRERLSWDELIPRACAADDQRTANVVYEAAAKLADVPAATLHTVVDLSAAGRSSELVKAVSRPTGQPYTEVATDVFAILVRAAALQDGVARWRNSWSGPFEFVAAEGAAFDADAIAALLIDAGAVQQGVARLKALGVGVH